MSPEIYIHASHIPVICYGDVLVDFTYTLHTYLTGIEQSSTVNAVTLKNMGKYFTRVNLDW